MRVNYRTLNAVVFLLFVLAITGCMPSLKRNHLKMVSAGENPTVALIVEMPSTVNIEYVGFTMFGNGNYSHNVQENYQLVAKNIIKERLTDIGLSKIIEPTSRSIEELNKSIEVYANKLAKKNECENDDNKCIEPSVKYIVNDPAKVSSVIIEWGKSINADLVMIVRPRHSESPIYGRAGWPIGVGMLDDRGYIFLHAVHELLIYDTKLAEITENASYASFVEIPTNHRQLSVSEMKQLKEEEKAALDGELVNITIHSQMIGDDYKELPPEMMQALIERLSPVFENNINAIFNIAFNVKSTNSWFERKKSDQPLIIVNNKQ